MAEFNFGFCPNSRTAEIIAPDEVQVKDFNGWDYTPTPVLPYRRRFKITLEGLYWRFADNGTIDYATDIATNAGVLEAFYSDHRMFKPFNFAHQYLGTIELRFNAPLSIPKALPNSNGLLGPFEFQAIHHNPSY